VRHCCMCVAVVERSIGCVAPSNALLKVFKTSGCCFHLPVINVTSFAKRCLFGRGSVRMTVGTSRQFRKVSCGFPRPALETALQSGPLLRR